MTTNKGISPRRPTFTSISSASWLVALLMGLMIACSMEPSLEGLLATTDAGVNHCEHCPSGQTCTVYLPTGQTYYCGPDAAISDAGVADSGVSDPCNGFCISGQICGWSSELNRFRCVSIGTDVGFALDAQVIDATTLDTGTETADAGNTVDAGFEPDVGHPDAQAVDSGDPCGGYCTAGQTECQWDPVANRHLCVPIDAGVFADATVAPDAQTPDSMVVDAGETMDAGQLADVGFPDATAPDAVAVDSGDPCGGYCTVGQNHCVDNGSRFVCEPDYADASIPSDAATLDAHTSTAADASVPALDAGVPMDASPALDATSTSTRTDAGSTVDASAPDAGHRIQMRYTITSTDAAVWFPSNAATLSIRLWCQGSVAVSGSVISVPASTRVIEFSAAFMPGDYCDANVSVEDSTGIDIWWTPDSSGVHGLLQIIGAPVNVRVLPNGQRGAKWRITFL